MYELYAVIPLFLLTVLSYFVFVFAINDFFLKKISVKSN